MARSLNSPIFILLSRILAMTLTFVSAPIIARVLGPEGRGQTAAALTIYGLLPIIFGLGLPIVARRLVVLNGKADPLIRYLRLYCIILIVPAGFIGWLIQILILPDLPHDQKIYFIIGFLITIPAGVLWVADANILIGQSRNFAFALINLMPTIFYVFSIVVGWGTNSLSIGFVLIANVLGTVATLVLSTFFTRIPIQGSISKAKDIHKEGLSFAGSQIAEASSYKLDQAVALPIIGAVNNGYYSIAATIGLLPYAIGQAIGTAIFREVALEKDTFEQKKIAAKAIRVAIMVTSLVAAIICIISPWLIPLMFGPDFQPSILPTIISLIGSIFLVQCYVSTSILTALGKGWLVTQAQLYGLTIGIISLFPMGFLWGAIGASIASGIGYITTALIAWFGIGINLKEIFPRKSDVQDSLRILLHGKIK